MPLFLARCKRHTALVAFTPGALGLQARGRRLGLTRHAVTRRLSTRCDRVTLR
jgi:hypothetical protein